MAIEVGREREMLENRLIDVVFLAENTLPAKDGDWEGYAKSVLRIIADQARQAQKWLSLMPR